MISLEYIKANTHYEIRLEKGFAVGTYDWLKKNTELQEFDEMEPVSPEAQPLEIKPFWLAYRRAVQEHRRKDLTLVDDFYAEWAKNPEQFEAPKRRIIGDLKSILRNYEDCPEETCFNLKNYDGLFIGAHGLVDFEKALEEIGNTGFDVINIAESLDIYTRRLTVRIVLQCDDLRRVSDLGILSNRYMADRIFGP